MSYCVTFTKCHRRIRLHSNTNRGSVMVAVLFLMIIIGIASAASLRNSVVDFKVATKSQAIHKAASLAEEAIITAEIALATALDDPTFNINTWIDVDGHFDFRNIEEQENIDWDTVASVSVYGATTDNEDNEETDDNEDDTAEANIEFDTSNYVIQYLGIYPRFGEASREKSAASTHSPSDISHYFRIVAQGTSKAGTRRQLVSIYRHDDINDFQ